MRPVASKASVYGPPTWVSTDEAHTIIATLQAESDAERRRRRSVMSEHWPKFLWDEGAGEAYEATLAALAKMVPGLEEKDEEEEDGSSSHREGSRS